MSEFVARHVLASELGVQTQKTAERYLLPRFGAWRLSDITAGAVNVWLLELKRERRAERLPSSFETSCTVRRIRVAPFRPSTYIEIFAVRVASS